MPPVAASTRPTFPPTAIEAVISGIFPDVRSPVAGLQRCAVRDGTWVQHTGPSQGDRSDPSPSHAVQSTMRPAPLINPRSIRTPTAREAYMNRMESDPDDLDPPFPRPGRPPPG